VSGAHQSQGNPSASSNWIGYAFFFVQDSAINWRIPLAIGGIPALVLAACVFLLPESPRFLVQNGRNEEALAICCKLQYEKANPDSELYLREHAQTVEQFELDKEAPLTWMSLVTVPHYRRRCIIGHLTMFFVQCSGNLVITNYAPILYGRLGYDVNKQLLLAGAWITLAPFGNLLNAYLLDKVGRRPLLSFGLMGCVVCLIAEAISVARFQATGAMSASLAAVAFLFFHVGFEAEVILEL
jgi:MFS family permease